MVVIVRYVSYQVRPYSGESSPLFGNMNVIMHLSGRLSSQLRKCLIHHQTNSQLSSILSFFSSLCQMHLRSTVLRSQAARGVNSSYDIIRLDARFLQISPMGVQSNLTFTLYIGIVAFEATQHNQNLSQRCMEYSI